MVTADPWSTLVAQAVLGGRADATFAADGPLGDCLRRVTPGDLATALALVHGWQRAGMLPRTGVEAPPPPPIESIPAVSTAAGHLLRSLLGPEGDARLTREYLAACARRGRRIPPDLVPDLLDLGRSTPGVRPLILAVLGATGPWLANQHPAWAWAFPEREASTWSTGTTAERLTLLAKLRPQDPAAANALIASTWQEDSPADRVAFLTALATGLGPADEALLEQALDDRRKDVREQARDLLRRIPGTQLSARCQASLIPCFTWKSGLFGHHLTVEPPTSYDRSWTRDGITEKPPTGMGERAWWLRQLLALVPPTTWSGTWQATPAAILAAAAKTDWADAVRHGLHQACTVHPDTPWIIALIGNGSASDPDALPLLHAVPAAEQEDLLNQMLPAEAGPRGHWLQLLARLGTAWSLPMTRRVVAILQELGSEQRGAHLPALAYQLHPAGSEPLLTAAGSDPAPAALERAQRILSLRLQIHQEFP